MGTKIPSEILWSEYATVFGRVVRVYGEDAITGINATGKTRAGVAKVIEKMIGEYLNQPQSETEREI